MSIWLSRGLFDSQEDAGFGVRVSTWKSQDKSGGLFADLSFFVHLARIQAIASIFNVILFIFLAAFEGQYWLVTWAFPPNSVCFPIQPSNLFAIGFAVPFLCRTVNTYLDRPSPAYHCSFRRLDCHSS